MREQHGPLKEQHGHGSRWQQNSRGKQAKPQRYEKQGKQRAHNEQREQREQREQGKPPMISFGNYDLVKRIDVGGMGEVYLAHQRTAFGREVAVKIIRNDLVHDVVARKRFLREAEVNAHLKHEHILSLVEFGEEQGRMFLVTPYISGGTLAQRLERGPMPLSEVHQLFTALVRAVAYIHKRGVVHRDLKPSNILLDYEDGQLNVRLIDFGIASIQGSADNPAPALTQAGHEMATIDYMAPERLDGIAAPSNDIYSLGIILYEMLTGQRPESESERVRLAAPLRYVVEHCTYPHPEDRFHSADQLLNVFEQAYRAVTTPPSASVPTATSQQGQTQTPSTGRYVSDNDVDETPHRMPQLTSLPVVPAVPVAPVVPAPIAPIVASNTQSFNGSDYSDKTTYIGPQHLAGQGQQTATLAPRKPRRRRSLLLVLTLITVAMLFLIGALGYAAFLNSIVATVNIGSQVHTVTEMLTIQAKPGQHSVDSTTSTVPAYIVTSTKTGSQTGNTTGVKCTFLVINCQAAVSFNDIDTLATSIHATLKTQVQQDLTSQEQANGETAVGQVYYSDGNPTSNPSEGTVSSTVTVTLTEQGSVEAIKTQDIQSLARTLLTQKAQQQYGSGYALLDTYTRIGNPVVQSVDASGIVTTQIAVGGVVEYNLSPSVMHSFENAIKGKKQQDASSYLMHQPGIDATTVIVRVSYGDTLPTNINQIHIVPLNPTNIPNVQLPTT